MIAVLLAASVWVTQAAHLKRRTDVPATFRTLTVERLLEASERAFPVGAAGRLRGYVVSRRREADGDWHLQLAASPKATRARSVVCEITPNFRPRVAIPKAGAYVTVSGWLFWDGHHLHEPGRGTQWEIHPVTAIVPAAVAITAVAPPDNQEAE